MEPRCRSLGPRVRARSRRHMVDRDPEPVVGPEGWPMTFPYTFHEYDTSIGAEYRRRARELYDQVFAAVDREAKKWAENTGLTLEQWLRTYCIELRFEPQDDTTTVRFTLTPRPRGPADSDLVLVSSAPISAGWTRSLEPR